MSILTSFLSHLSSFLSHFSSNKRRVYISYHQHLDQGYCDLFSVMFNISFETIKDNSFEREFDSDDPENAIRRIRRKYINYTSCTIVLCGPQTKWRKYVDWEIKATLDKQHGLIGIKLSNNKPDKYGVIHIPDRLQDNVDSGYAILIQWEDLLKGPEYLKETVELANSRSPLLIRNKRPLLSQNKNVLLGL